MSKRVIKIITGFQPSAKKSDGCIYSGENFCELKKIGELNNKRTVLKVGVGLNCYQLTNKQLRRIIQLTNDGFNIKVNLEHRNMNTNKIFKLYGLKSFL
jgi:hypothetical protein